MNQIYCYLCIFESDEVVFNREEAKDVDTTVPNDAFIDDGCMKGQRIAIDHEYALFLQSDGIIIFVSCVQNNLLSVYSHIYQPLRNL